MITLNATHQQTKRLVDPVIGTYQTVLTIDSSVGPSDIVGTYNCTVENVRGKSSMTVVVGELNLNTYGWLYACCCYPPAMHLTTYFACDNFSSPSDEAW